MNTNTNTNISVFPHPPVTVTAASDRSTVAVGIAVASRPSFDMPPPWDINVDAPVITPDGISIHTIASSGSYTGSGSGAGSGSGSGGAGEIHPPWYQGQHLLQNHGRSIQHHQHHQHHQHNQHNQQQQQQQREQQRRHNNKMGPLPHKMSTAVGTGSSHSGNVVSASLASYSSSSNRNDVHVGGGSGGGVLTSIGVTPVSSSNSISTSSQTGVPYTQHHDDLHATHPHSHDHDHACNWESPNSSHGAPTLSYPPESPGTPYSPTPLMPVTFGGGIDGYKHHVVGVGGSGSSGASGSHVPSPASKPNLAIGAPVLVTSRFVTTPALTPVALPSPPTVSVVSSVPIGVGVGISQPSPVAVQASAKRHGKKRLMGVYDINTGSLHHSQSHIHSGKTPSSSSTLTTTPAAGQTPSVSGSAG
ncbi:hypothetical protein HK102_011309, partial [Quaeritorhiza haematococci]